MSDEELKRRDLDWNISKVNSESPSGRIIGPMYATEMIRRGLSPMVKKSLEPTDLEKHFNLVCDAVDGKL